MKSLRAAALAAFAASAALSAAPAWSQDSGFYLGGHWGYADYRNACERVTVSCDNKDNALKLFAGYQVNRYFGAELAWNDLRESRASSSTASAKKEYIAWEVVAVPSIPIPVVDRLALYGKVGFYRSYTRVQGTGAIPGFALSAAESDRHSDPTWGLGARYGFTNHIFVRAEWQRYVTVGGPRTGDTDIDTFTFGALYKF